MKVLKPFQMKWVQGNANSCWFSLREERSWGLSIRPLLTNSNLLRRLWKPRKWKRVSSIVCPQHGLCRQWEGQGQRNIWSLFLVIRFECLTHSFSGCPYLQLGIRCLCIFESDYSRCACPWLGFGARA